MADGDGHIRTGNLLGRVLAVMTSRRRAAYTGALVTVLGPLCRAIDRFAPRRVGVNEQDRGPRIMIVSPPRSGSTVVYQVLTRTIPSVYISNLHALFPSRATRWLHAHGALGSAQQLSSFFGYTAEWSDVNEGNEILCDFLFAGDDSGLSERWQYLHTLLTAGTDRPLIFKNVRYYSEISRLAAADPELRFIEVRRDPVDTAQSILAGHERTGTFHPIPPELNRQSILAAPVEFACNQVVVMRNAIRQQLALLPSTRWLTLHYDEFCRIPEECIQQLGPTFLRRPAELARFDQIKKRLVPSVGPRGDGLLHERLSVRIREIEEQLA